MRTKYLIVILFASVFTTGQILAQDDDMDLRDNVGFGLKIGVNSSNLYDSDNENFEHDPKLGLAFGAFLSVPLGKVIGFQPEIMYSQKGYTGSGSILTADYEYTRKTDYIDVPLQLQIKPAPFLTLLAGPQYSFLIKKGIDFESGTITVDQEKEIEDTDIRKNTLGAVVGLDFNFSRAVLSGRLAWDLQHNDEDGNSVAPRYKNVVAQITLGVRF